MCQETSKEVVHPRNLTNNFPKMAIFEAGVHLFQGPSFWCHPAVSFWRCIVMGKIPPSWMQSVEVVKVSGLATRVGGGPKVWHLGIVWRWFLLLSYRALGEKQQKKCLEKSELLLFRGSRFFLSPTKISKICLQESELRTAFQAMSTLSFFY